jgi:hypothetical protein
MIMVSSILLITGSTVIPLLFVACVFSPLFLKMDVRSPAFNVSGTRPCLKISLRGFISGSLPVNSTLPVEECYREVVDNDTDCQLILFDAKAAFD